MATNRKTILTIVVSALAGSLLGGIVVGFAIFYFMSQFFSDTIALSSSNQLNLNIWALEKLRTDNKAKAINQLEQEARANLTTVSAFQTDSSESRKEDLLNSIANAKQYFEKYPLKYVSEDEKYLFDQAFEKVERNSHNKSPKLGTPKNGAP